VLVVSIDCHATSNLSVKDRLSVPVAIAFLSVYSLELPLHLTTEVNFSINFKQLEISRFTPSFLNLPPSFRHISPSFSALPRRLSSRPASLSSAFLSHLLPCHVITRLSFRYFHAFLTAIDS
jgi:hypothetical protein